MTQRKQKLKSYRSMRVRNKTVFMCVFFLLFFTISSKRSVEKVAYTFRCLANARFKHNHSCVVLLFISAMEERERSLRRAGGGGGGRGKGAGREAIFARTKTKNLNRIRSCLGDTRNFRLPFQPRTVPLGRVNGPQSCNLVIFHEGHSQWK